MGSRRCGESGGVVSQGLGLAHLVRNAIAVPALERPMSHGHTDITTLPPRVKDLRFGSTIQTTCKSCGHEAEVKSTLLRSYPLVILKMPIHEFGEILRCTRCDALGAWLDADGAIDERRGEAVATT